MPRGGLQLLHVQSTAGFNASNASFTFLAPHEVFPAPASTTYPNFEVLGTSGKNTIDTVYSGMAGREADNLPLSATRGFCCRAEFSGGRTVAGTIYVGDLEVRAYAAPPSASPSVTPTPSATVSTTSTASLTATASASWSPSPSQPPPAGAAAADVVAVALTAPAASGLVIGAALAGAAATVALQFALRRLRGFGGGAGGGGGAAGLGALSSASREGVGAAAARERVALLGRVGVGAG